MVPDGQIMTSERDMVRDLGPMSKFGVQGEHIPNCLRAPERELPPTGNEIPEPTQISIELQPGDPPGSHVGQPQDDARDLAVENGRTIGSWASGDWSRHKCQKSVPPGWPRRGDV